MNSNEANRAAELSLSNSKDSTPKKPGVILITLLVIVTFLSVSASFINQYLQSGMISQGVGGALSPIIIGLLVVAFFQIFKSFRNSRSRYKTFLWLQVIFFASVAKDFIGFIIKNI